MTIDLGNGWTLVEGPDKHKPFMLFLFGRFRMRFATQQEAEDFVNGKPDDAVCFNW